MFLRVILQLYMEITWFLWVKPGQPDSFPAKLLVISRQEIIMSKDNSPATPFHESSLNKELLITEHRPG